MSITCSVMAAYSQPFFLDFRNTSRSTSTRAIPVSRLCSFVIGFLKSSDINRSPSSCFFSVGNEESRRNMQSGRPPLGAPVCQKLILIGGDGVSLNFHEVG